MRETNFNVSKSKGELNMKRTIVILALVTAFVLAFTAVAQATWRGFTPTRPVIEAVPMIANPAAGEPGHIAAVPVGEPIANPNFVGLQGFLSFPEGRAEMARNLAPGTGNFQPGGDYEDFGHRIEQAAGLQGSAHGGYVTTTTKCVVCHSAHRATGIEDPTMAGSIAIPGSRVQRMTNQAFLTAGNGSSCEACHVAGSAQASRLLVEWGGPWNGYTGGGPHAGARRGCVLCHNAGIHGLSGSEFNVMNVFMLGNTRRAGLAGSGTMPTGTPTPGAIHNNMTRDQQIRAEMNLWIGADSRNNVTISYPGQPGATAGNTWWATGVRMIGDVGGLPGEHLTDPQRTALGLPSGAEYAAARSMATAYTCGESGCHAVGAFFTQNWGVGFDRRSGHGSGAGNQTLDDGVNDVGVRQLVTGHVNPGVRVTQVNLAAAVNFGEAGPGACGPCHGGSPAGFPTASTVEGERDDSRRAYGCDQCHDMVGVATNSTAWPHGNRNILVYEWHADGTQVETFAAAGNLWMYAGNIARAATVDAQGNRVGVVGTTGGHQTIDIGDGAAVAAFRGPTSENMAFADQSWFVMTNVGSGRYGVPSDVPANNWGTGLVDGSCLKCHVALDQGSLDALQAVGADAIRHTWQSGTNAGVDALVNPNWDGFPVGTGSQRLFLYR